MVWWFDLYWIVIKEKRFCYLVVLGGLFLCSVSALRPYLYMIHRFCRTWGCQRRFSMRAFCVNGVIMPKDIWIKPYRESALRFKMKVSKFIV